MEPERSPLKRLVEGLRLWLIALPAAGVLRLLGMTLRWRLLGYLEQQKIWSESAPRIFALWHGQQLLAPSLFLACGGKGRTKGVYVLISQHRDGRIIAYASRLLGFRSVAGSSTRRGAAAVLELIERLRQGFDILVTPDGPRGPLQQVKPGILKVAQETGIPIYPVACHAERHWRVGSWDKMIIPKPFSRCSASVGKPIVVPPHFNNGELESMRAILEADLKRLTDLVATPHASQLV